MKIESSNNAVGKEQLIIDDIAKMAGVSKSTVSRVLNNSSLVNKITKKKVLRVIEELNYTPNALARGLKTKTSRTIGLMVPDISNSFYAELTRGVEVITSKYGFSMFLCCTSQSPEKEEYYLNEMLERRTNGLIIVSTKIGDSSTFKKIKESMELVAVQTDLEDVDRLSVTDEQGMSSIVEHLIGLGHKKIAFIGFRFDISTIKNRLLGYRKTLRKYNIPTNESYIIEADQMGGDASENGGYLMAKKLLELEERPTAIQCLNDNLAIGAYLAALEKKLRIPEDISITGFDNIIVSRLMSPSLTTVAQPTYSLGEIGAELLIKNILEGNKPIKQSIVLPTSLIIRESTACPKA